MEAKTTLARRQPTVQGDFMRKMLTNAGCLLCGILVSRGAVLGIVKSELNFQKKP